MALQTKGDGGNDQDDWAFTPTSRLPDTERFRGVEPLRMTCRSCREQADFQGVFAWDRKKPVNGPGDIRVSALPALSTFFVYMPRLVAFTVFLRSLENNPGIIWKRLPGTFFEVRLLRTGLVNVCVYCSVRVASE